MSARLASFSGLLMVFFLSPAWAVLNCGSGFQPVMEKLKVSEFANDLEPLAIYQDGEEISLAPGGEGPLAGIVTSWIWESNGSFVEQVHALDFELLEFDRADTDTVLLDASSDGRLTLEFCMPENTDSVTIHAIYGEFEVRGVQSTVGHVRGGQINAVANRATTAWFKKFNEGKERSGSEQLLRIMKQHFGSRAPRLVTEKQVIALNAMYSAALAAEQLTGGNDLNVDVEGTTVYVEKAPTRMCFSDLTTEFRVSGVDLLVNHCVTGLEQHIGKRYIARTNGLYKTGTIENADLGMTLVANECSGATGTVPVHYGNTQLNIQTVFRQNGQDTLVAGPDPVFIGSCDEITVTSSALGNQEQPLYRRSVSVFTSP